MVHYLEEFMASRLFDINQKDDSGNTPLDYAIKNHHKNSINFLEASTLLENSPEKKEDSKIKYGGGTGFFERKESSHTNGDQKYKENNNSCCIAGEKSYSGCNEAPSLRSRHQPDL